MFAKNLKYYRLKNNLSKKDLALKVGVSSMAITHYENGDRKPEMSIVKKLASSLNVSVVDFIASRNQNLEFTHEEFRKNSKMSKTRQEYIRESVEEYFGRFFDAVEMLGGEVLPEVPNTRKIPLSSDNEENGRALRNYLGIADLGPVGNLVEIIENKGILLYLFDPEESNFAGINGTVSGRPYIVVNKNMTAERIRTTIGHEVAHFAFDWPVDMGEKEKEKLATAISGAFLFPKQDAVRELGVRRRAITTDMYIVCKEYGIALSLLVVRAHECGIINETIYKKYFMSRNKNGGAKNEISRIPAENSHLFEQLVYRAVNEEEISVQRGAELLKMPYDYVELNCRHAEV